MTTPDDRRAVLQAWRQRDEDELLYDADLWAAQHPGPVEDTRPSPTWSVGQEDVGATLWRQAEEDA